MRARVALPLTVLLGAVVRAPFWVEALRTPLDGDGAVLGLMALHPLRATTMWGQPYGSPVEAWALAPLLAAFGPRAEMVRLGHFLLGLALIPMAWALARRLHPHAGLPAALVLACPPPYFLLLASMPPPLYPAALLLCAGVLLAALVARDRLRAGADARSALALWGALSGWALWTHLMSCSVVLVTAVFLLRAGGARRLLAWGLLPLAVAASPWWTRALTASEQATRVVAVSGRRASLGDHLAEVAPRLHEPLLGLLGAHTPLVADDPEHVVHAAAPVVGLLVLAYGALLVAALFSGAGRGATGMLLAAAALTLLVFPFPLRAHPGAIRFLTPLYLPLVAVLLWPAVARGGGRRGVVVALLLGALHLAAAGPLLAAWRAADRRAPPFLLVDLTPVRDLLRARGVRHAYASYGPAYRLTFESGEQIVASQPWNERFLHYPLPYRDDVRFAHDVAWVLTPSVPSDLPMPRAFEDALGAAGGAWTRTDAGEAVVFHGFVPPFAPDVTHPPAGGPIADGDPATAAAPAPAAPLDVPLGAAAPLDAITLVAGDVPLPRSMDVEVSADGDQFSVVARRRRRGERDDLRWVDGHPEYVLDNDVIAVPLQGRAVAAVRIRPVDSDEPWSLAELLLHPSHPGAQLRSWDEWLDPALRGRARRDALSAQPHRDREDWYVRSRLAAVSRGR